MSEQSGIVYRFGPFRYDSAQRLLFKGDELVQLVPKALDTLQALLEHRGEVVGKAELMKAVWPDCVVEEIGLARNVSLLRKALGDEAEAYIETIPKRGYRFTAEGGESAPAVRHQQASPPHRAWLVFASILVALGGIVYWQFYRPSRFLPRAGGTASLAVIPVEYLSPDPARSAVSEVFTEALAEELSKIKSAHVSSPSTVERYRRLHIPTAIMARMLGLDVIVEGTVQTFGSRLRVWVRLTDVHSGKLIWADTYETPAADADESLVNVARSVAGQVGRCLAVP